MTRLVLIRHAESEGNRTCTLHGRTDWPLSTVGEQQCLLLADALANEQPAAIYSSPLIRARHTAAAIAARHSIEPVVLASLTECDFGDYDGLTVRQFMRAHPRLWVQLRNGQLDDVAFPGGDSVLGFHGRVRDSVETITSNHPGAMVIVVAHCWVIASALAQLLDMPAAWMRYAPANCGISTIDVFHGTQANLVAFNDCQHLMVPA